MPAYDECHLFVDGSCLRPEAGPLRLAAWAVIIAPPGSDAPGIPLTDGLVPGILQSAFRAELCATVSALLYCARVRRPTTVWSDCKGVVCKVRSFLCGSWFPSSRCRRFDLWTLIGPRQETLSSLARICKVDSHLDPASENTFGDEWCAERNNQADQAAARAHLLRPPEFWRRWRELCQHWDAEWVVAKEVLALQLRIATFATRTAGTVKEPTLQTPSAPLEAHFLGDIPENPGCGLFRKYGSDYIHKLFQFDSLLQSADASVRWISSLQLYIGFASRFGRPMTLHLGKWTDLSKVKNGSLVHVGVAKRVRHFMQHLRECAKAGQGRWRPIECRPCSTAMKVKLSCVAAQMEETFFQEIEEYLFRQLPRGTVTGNSRGWRSLPLPGP